MMELEALGTTCYGNDIEANKSLVLNRTGKFTCSFFYQPGLMRRNKLFRVAEAIVFSGFHLHKDQNIPFPGDDIYLPPLVDPVCFLNDPALAFKKICGSLLAPMANIFCFCSHIAFLKPIPFFERI